MLYQQFLIPSRHSVFRCCAAFCIPIWYDRQTYTINVTFVPKKRLFERNMYRFIIQNANLCGIQLYFDLFFPIQSYVPLCTVSLFVKLLFAEIPNSKPVFECPFSHRLVIMSKKCSVMVTKHHACGGKTVII